MRKLHAAVANVVEVRALDAFLLTVASAVLLVASILWPPPDERQIAQQMLNDRGMFLTPQYFQTAIQVGNASGVALFLDAGFPPPLAANLFSADAGTKPGKRVIDTFFDLEEETRHTILRHLARAADEEKAGEATRSVFNLRLDGSGRSETTKGQAPVSLPGVDLLGHALMVDSRSTVEMLRLGADPYRSVAAFLDRTATGLSLLGAGTVRERGRDQWEFAADVYRYVSSVDPEGGLGRAAVAQMVARGSRLVTAVRPDYASSATTEASGLTYLGRNAK